jgi:dipeptidyl aminopeptidase/acylaminoacyl peptidase
MPKSAPLPINRLYLAHDNSEPAFGGPDELFYARSVDGRRNIYRQSLATGLAQAITTEPAPGGGIGSGGGSYGVRGRLFVYAAKDSRLYRIDLETGEQRAITPAYEGVAAPAISPDGGFVAFLAEQDGGCNLLLVDSAGEQLPVRLTHDAWYVFNPAWSPDGTHLAWMQWDSTDMPWDECRIVVARLARPIGECEVVAQALPQDQRSLSQARVSYASPQFSPDGRCLAYTSDESGWRSLWVTRLDAEDLHHNATRIDTGPGEIGGPDWVPGEFKMRWAADGSALYAIRRRESRGCLLRVAWPNQNVTEMETRWSWLRGLNAEGEQLAFLGSRPTQPESVVTLDLRTGASTARATTAVGLTDPETLVEPAVMSWPTAGGATSWGILYQAREAGPRPLIVSVHGGPTSERGLNWEADAQYFATRGWHYLLVNHRGGTGFGRAYQNLLDGQWGVVDVEDARSGAEHLIRAGLADPRRLVITGHSAGGYTTLMALTADPDFWTAGVALSGIGHMYDMKQGAHRFEVNYEDRLIGQLPEAGPLWVERSPLAHVKNVRAPVLLFHGAKDKVVPVRQSIDFAEAVRRNGGSAELVVFDEEGHSFGLEANLRTIYETMERFLDKYVMCQQR